MAATESLSRAAGLDLAAYCDRHVRRRVSAALEREGVESSSALARLLQTDDAARARFRASLAVSVTSVFRDRHQFELLEREVLPGLLAEGGRLHVWSAGCANGAELYGVALVLRRLRALERAFLLGSDVLTENVARARAGDYAPGHVSRSMRSRLHWERRDLVRDGAPPGHWRLILCRNVGIYLEPTAKERLHRLLADALAPGGVLLLGRSESLADPAALGLRRLAPHAYRKPTA